MLWTLMGSRGESAEGSGGGATVPAVLQCRGYCSREAARASERRLGLGVLGTPAAGLRPRPAREKSPLCVPNLLSPENSNILGSVKIGQYTEWFHDVSDREISSICEDALKLLCSTFGCQIEEIILPELEEMRTAHVVSIGSESFCDLNPHYKAGRRTEFTLDTRTSLALFGSFSSTDYVASQCIRRRIMHYHMEAFKKVDVIATPTTGMTAPKIPPSALKSGESDYVVSDVEQSKEYQEPPSVGHFEQQEQFEEVPGDAEEFTQSYQEYEDF